MTARNARFVAECLAFSLACALMLYALTFLPALILTTTGGN